jgi:hypothetical protein
MIYMPSPGAVSVYQVLGAGAVQAGLAALGDFVAGTNKPWTYYLGVGTAGAAMATGYEGAGVAIFAMGEFLDATFLHSPEGSEVDCFLDGVAIGTINTYAASEMWNDFRVNLDTSRFKRVDFVNRTPGTGNVSGIAWMALGGLTLSGLNAQLQEQVLPMANPYSVSFSIEDRDGDNNTVVVFVDNTFTLAQYQGFVTAFAPLLDGVTNGKVVSATLNMEMTLPGGLKASATSGAENQVGGLWTLATPARYKHGIRVPALVDSLFVGKNVNYSAAGAAQNFTNALTGGVDVSGTQIIPRDGYGNDLTSVATAVKSIRRK